MKDRITKEGKYEAEAEKHADWVLRGVGELEQEVEWWRLDAAEMLADLGGWVKAHQTRITPL